MSKNIYSIGDDDEIEVHELRDAIKIETQFLPRQGRTTVFFPIRREDLFSGDTDEIMNAGVYFRTAIDLDWFHLSGKMICFSIRHLSRLPILRMPLSAL